MPKLLLGNADHNNVKTSLQHIVLESIFDLSNLKQSEVQFIPLKSNSKRNELRRLLTRGTLLGSSEKQSVGRLKIYPKSNLFKQNVLDKLLELKLLKLAEETEICLGNIPMNLFFDVKSASTKCCIKCGNDRIKGADKLAEKQRSGDNQDVICDFNYDELYDGKKVLNPAFEAQIPKVINLLPFFSEEAFHSTDFTLPYHENITYIYSNEAHCDNQSSNQVKLINLETYSDSMRVEHQFPTRNINMNMKLQHVNSVMTFSESASNILKTQSGIDRANIPNESLIEYDNFVNVNQTELPNSGTLFMQFDYPRTLLVYSLINQQYRMLKRPKCSLETGDKLNRKITNVKCKCKEKQEPCSCLHKNDKTNHANRFSSSGGGRTCGCLHLDKIFSSDKTIVRKLSEVHELRATRTNICRETTLTKHDFSNETTKIRTSSPMRLDLMSMWNQGKQSLTKSEDNVAEKPQWNKECADTRRTKRKCGCTRPYETSTPLPFSSPPRSAQKKRPCKISDELIGPFEKPKTRECREELNVKQANCRINVNNRKERHLCDVCKLFYGIGDIMDEKESLISIEFSDVDKLISILDDVKNTGSKISTSIKRLTEKGRNAESNDFDEYLLTCSTEGTNKPNTIGLKIKYSDYKCEDQSRHVKSDSCSCLRANLKETDTRKDIKCIFQKVCPGPTSSIHGPERTNGADCVCATKRIYECPKSRDQEVDSKKSKVSRDCRSSPERRICQGQVTPLVEVEFEPNGDVKNKVECIFKNERACLYSSKSIKMEEQVIPKSCYKDSCPKLTEPLIFPEKQDCLVEGSCIREKLLRTICVIPELSAAENAEPLKSTTQKKGSQKKASSKAEKKEISKTSKKKADSSKSTPGKPLPKKNSKKTPSTAPNKVPSKQKNPKEKVSSPSVNKAPTPKKKSKQKTSVSDTAVPASKAKSKQKTSRSDTKVPAPKTKSKQTKSLSDSKIPERKTNSKKSKSSTDTKVPAQKTNSKQTTSANATKTSGGKANSKKSSISATKKSAGKTKSKEKTSIDTDQKPSSKSKPSRVPKKQTKTRRESSVSKKPEVALELPVLRLNEVDQALLSHALDAFLRMRGF